MGYKILLADDSITIQKVVELVLSPEGFQISAFNNGEQALAEIDTIRPNLILADVEMPKINGYELCKKIKSNPNTSEIPVILLVGAFEPFDENEAKAVGADDFIIKPFESQELISKVKALVKDFPETTDVVEEEAIQDIGHIEETETSQDKESEITFTEDDFALLQGQFHEEEQIQEPTTQEQQPETFKEVFEEAVKSQQATDVNIAMPALSKEEIIEIYKGVITEQVTKLLDDSFKEVITMAVKDKISEIVSNITPSIVENTTSQILSGISVEIRDKTISILNHFIPEVAQEMVQREINRITADI
ncbi:MAG: response regulator [Thermodesulfovibrionales bacterium]|nr:response regulator [Thermodesulfovibrionales bacterium]